MIKENLIDKRFFSAVPNVPVVPVDRATVTKGVGVSPPSFFVPEGYVLVPRAENLSHELVQKLEDAFDEYIIKRIDSRRDNNPAPAWPNETKEWPLPMRFIYNKVIELTGIGSQ